MAFVKRGVSNKNVDPMNSPTAAPVPAELLPSSLVTKSSRGGIDLANASTTAHNSLPHTRTYRFLFIGGGVTAGYFAHTLVTKGIRHGELCILSGESVPPYERPAINKGYLNNPADFGKMLTCGFNGAPHSITWYANFGIDLKLSTWVTHFDPHTKTAVCSDGFHYQGLEAVIIGTGCSARYLPVTQVGDLHTLMPIDCTIPPAMSIHLVEDKSPYTKMIGTHYMNNRSDADDLLQALKQSKAKTAVVVGGGYLAMEMAAYLTTRGLQVTVTTRSLEIFTGDLPGLLASSYRKYFEKKGIEFVLGTKAIQLVGHNNVFKAVRLKDNRVLEADMAVIAIGCQPNIGPFRHSVDLIPTRNKSLKRTGIPVDGSLETNVPGVFAVGDVCVHPLFQHSTHNGGSAVQHVDHARRSATFLAEIILDLGTTKRPVYHYHPSLYSRFFDRSWRLWGDLTYDNAIIIGDIESRCVGLFLWEMRVLGAFIESGKSSEALVLEAATRQQCAVDIISLRSAKTVEQAVDIIALALEMESLLAMCI